MRIPRQFYVLLAFFALIAFVVADSNSTVTTSKPPDGLIFSTVTSGTVVQTLVLKTTTITSCPCSSTAKATAAVASAGPTLPVIQGSSAGNTIRPGLFVVMAVGVFGSAVFVLA